MKVSSCNRCDSRGVCPWPGFQAIVQLLHLGRIVLQCRYGIHDGYELITSICEVAVFQPFLGSVYDIVIVDWAECTVKIAQVLEDPDGVPCILVVGFSSGAGHRVITDGISHAFVIIEVDVL